MILINLAAPNRMGMISRYSAVSLPISVGVLAGYLLHKNTKVKIVDELVSPIDESLTNIEEIVKDLERPYIFGISCLTINIGRGFEIARWLKDRYPDSKIVFGGIHPTILPEESLGVPYVDVVVRGEGEETLYYLYNALRNNKDISGIEGISFKEGKNIRHNPDRPLVKDLDSISYFPYEIFRNSKYNLDFVLTSRGCPFNCIFCSQRHISGRKFRFRSTENVIKEIDLLVNKYNQYSINFLDDDFLVNKDRVKQLCAAIIKNKLNAKANFGFQTRADNVNEEILDILKEAGFTFVGLGMETGSERLMKLINKGETVRDNIRAAELINKKGFNINAFFIFGLPSETQKERFQGYMLVKRLKLRYAKFNNIVPYPGTALFDMAKEEGSLNIEKDWSNFNSVGGIVEGAFSRFKPPYVPKGTTEKELKRDIIRANLYFYIANLLSLFVTKKGNPGWFVLSKKWYLKPSEYFYLAKLASRFLINAIAVFNFKWFINEILCQLRIKKISID